MRHGLILGCLLLMAETAIAQTQPPPDPATLQKVIQALQAQRNQAMDALASAQTQSALLSEENAKLKTENEALKKKPE
jgi:hypothetical protein